MVEAMRLAFADARQYVADLATDPAPMDWLLSDAYADERRALISPDAAMLPPSFGMPPAGSDTVYLSVVDGQGNACSFINSLYTGFGSGIVGARDAASSCKAGARCSRSKKGIPTCSRPTSARITRSSRRWRRKTASCGRRSA